jgi:small-conductance mechanosensitive channel
MELLSTWVPRWIIGVAMMGTAALVVLALYRWVIALLIRLIEPKHPFIAQLLQRGHQPAAAILAILALAIVLPVAGFPFGWTLTIGHVLLIGFILALGWTAGKAVDLGAEVYLRRFRIDSEDNLLARKHYTQVNILRRAVHTLLIIITLAVALMTLDQVRQYGVSLFASAGAAGLILGLAARPVLSNLLAGIQIAMTQPIRIDDAVIVEGEWGVIEKITSTYVVVRIWDLRRLIVPLSYFIENPFQNWTHETANLIGSVFLRVDYSVPLERLRAELKRIVGETPLWDGKVVVLQVTDTPANMVELRCLASARNSGQAWDLRCHVREKMIEFLQAEYPDALPRQRTEIVGELPPVAERRAPQRPAEVAAEVAAERSA